MDSGVASASLVVLLLVVVGYVSVVYFFSPKYDPREPPVLSHYIPYVGHVLGLIRYGQYYFEMLRSVFPLSTLSTLSIMQKNFINKFTTSQANVLNTFFQRCHYVCDPS